MSCYDHPQYWDLSFRSETKLEAEFFEAAFDRHAVGSVRNLLEPGCGGGRLLIEMAARGYHVTGYDLSEPCVQYVRQRLKRRRLSGSAVLGDMIDHVVSQPVDAAFCTFSTFRHLTTEAAAVGHLRAMAANVRPGGLYILGLHLIPLDADPDDNERWTARHASTRVDMSLKVVDFDRRNRLERLRFTMTVTSPTKRLRLTSEYDYRIYIASQFLRMLAKVPDWELLETYDFWYDINDPVELNEDSSDTVFVLRRNGDHRASAP